MLKCRTSSDFLEVFTRRGEEIVLSGRSNPVRVSPLVYSIGALTSLLPSDDPVREILEPISSFFSGVTYYGLTDPPQVSDLIPERAYEQWARRTESAGQVTESVGLRLIHMMKEDPGMFAEFQALVGPDGLDLVKRTQLVSISSAQVVGQGGSTKAVPQESFYYPAFEPAGHMGGAGLSFRFSQLSDGSRRAIRIVTALLFDKRSLMLMEQPEDSIHPGLLRKLIDVLRSYSSNSQIVFTTHSPDVLDVLEPNEVLLVSALTDIQRPITSRPTRS